MNKIADTFQSPAEQEHATRVQLAALYRLVAHFRLTDMIDTHITARVPGESPSFLINRHGVLFQEMCASDLVRIDYLGRVCEGENATHEDVNAAGFVIHSAIHMARPDLHFIIHTHSASGIAVAAQEHGLLPISQHAMKYYEKLAYHDYEGIALSLSERERLVNDLGQHNAMILRNHGLLTAGATAHDAFQEFYYLERACDAQIKALAGGSPLRMPSPEVCRLTASQYVRESSPRTNKLAWQAALRLIDKDMPDYRS
ncbi:class II aldolase/adducin family protein [Caballeronia sp. GACF4]|uniref:class II aldolase/adducin family protein n=1 Tax=Caballeronia sp. GACF4 TaxID=2921763 RepID=UPI002027BBD6|nr:class II aldolase/adducin family protein [Caballeronia sp. GACF4]